MAHTGGWGLEVVRGREVGKTFPLAPGRSVLGRGLDGAPGVDLAAQEGNSPRQMAPRQAEVECAPGGLTLRDLDSPGGTFVNRQRLLSGQGRPLQPGDLIQVGGVQLRVVPLSAPTAPKPVPVAGPPPAKPAPAPVPAPAPPPAPPPPSAGKAGALPAPFTLATGTVCRGWDDFLTASGQNWAALRDEMTSGRLAAFLRNVGRDDLRPIPGASRSADEQLDDWLGRLPTTRAVRADLEVYPTLIRVRAMPGGGQTRVKFVITSTGYRLLRSRVRVEPPADAWITVGAEHAGQTVVTPESTEIRLEVQIPEALGAARTGFVVVEGNGGDRRVEVRVEPPAKVDAPPEPGPGDAPAAGWRPRDALAARPAGARVVWGALTAFGVRVLAALSAFVPGLGGGPGPSLGGLAALSATAGGLAAARFASRRGEPRDVPPSAFAGAFAGVLAAALVVAACRAVEVDPARGGLASAVLGCGIWGVLGALAGWTSCVVVPVEAGGGNDR